MDTWKQHTGHRIAYVQECDIYFVVEEDHVSEEAYLFRALAPGIFACIDCDVDIEAPFPVTNNWSDEEEITYFDA